MAVIDELEIIDGYFEDERFIMRGIAGHAMIGAYKADGLYSLARLIHDKEPFSFIIGVVPARLLRPLDGHFLKK